MGRKILFISCGKRNGSTFQTVKVAAAAAEAAGAETRVVEAIRLKGIGRGCYSCMKCQKSATFGCVFQDEVAELLLQMQNYDTLVFGAPVYFFSFGLQAKGIIDRMLSLVKYDGEVLRSPIKEKRFALIVTSGGGAADSGVKNLRGSFRNLVQYFSGTIAGELYFPNCDVLTGGLANDIEMPGKARVFGRKLAE